MTHHSASQLEWIQRYEMTLNTMCMEQLASANQGIASGVTSVIDGAYRLLDMFVKHRADVIEGGSRLTHPQRVTVDTMVKFRMGDVHPNGA